MTFRSALRGIAAASLCFAPAAKADQKPLRIGLSAPILGGAAVTGAHMRDGAQAAADAINAGGGIDGRRVEIVIGDDQGSPVGAVNVANKFASENIRFVVGPIFTGATRASNHVYGENNVVQMTLSQIRDLDGRGPNGALQAPRHDFMFRALVSNAFIIPAMGDLASGAVRPALIFQRDPYAEDIATGLRDALARKGRTLVYDQGYAGSMGGSEKDYFALATGVVAAKTDTLFLASSSAEWMGLVTRQLREGGFRGRIVLPGTGVLDEFAHTASCPAAGDAFAAAAPDPVRTTDGGKALGATLQARGQSARDVTAFTYDAVMTLARAVQQAGSENPSTVRKILQTNQFDGVSGPIRFNEARDLSTGAVWHYRWQCNGPKAVLEPVQR